MKFRRNFFPMVRKGTLWLVFLSVAAREAAGQQPRASSDSGHAIKASKRWWVILAGGFASSILAHEGGHVVAAYAVGGRPTFGLDAGRPTIFSGIDASQKPSRQFVFSSAGLTVQSLIDEGILDAPHGSGRAAGPFERGMLAGGIATSLFYVTIGRSGSVSDVDFMARTSTLSKTAISLIYGGSALVHIWRIRRDSRYADFFARPDPRGGMRVGLTLEP